jgi:regulatory protein YycH of two-component signal transduction system YycFG
MNINKILDPLEILESYKTNHSLNESSLQRIWQHITNPKTIFAVVSAYRGGMDNESRHRQLAKDIRDKGFGYIEQKGGYTYEDPETGEEGTSEEKSYLIPNIPKKVAIDLALKYSQESILYKDFDGFFLIETATGNIWMKFSTSDQSLTFDPAVVKKAYSQLIKTNANQRVKVAYIAEKIIPTRTEAYLSIKAEKLPQSRWVKVLE